MNQFNLPLCMIVEEGAISKLYSIIHDVIPDIKRNKVIFVTSSELLRIFSHEITNSIKSFPNCEFYLIEESSFDKAVELAKNLCINNVSIVIGFGGGKVLDTTKYASFVAKAKYFCVPTTLSNDGLASPIAVLNSIGLKRKSFGCKIPSGLIVDIDIVSKAPTELLKAGIGDTLSNYTALYDWKLDRKNHGDKVDDFAYMLADMSFTTLFYNEEKSLASKNFIKLMTQSLVLSGLAMEIAGNSRPCSGSEHLFSHALDEYYNNIVIPHGIAVALGSIVSCIFQGRDYSVLLDYLRAYDISINPMRFGITKDIFTDAWLKAKNTRKDRYTILNEIELSKDRLDSLYDLILEETN